jgi:hypothetical protein
MVSGRTQPKDWSNDEKANNEKANNEKANDDGGAIVPYRGLCAGGKRGSVQ